METEYTPHFKHPPLKGQSELESITLLGELQNLDDLYSGSLNGPVAVSANDPSVGDPEHFNVDNHIVREAVRSKLKQEFE